MLSIGLIDGTAPRLVDQHWDALGFGWRRREDRLRSPACDFASLCADDDRMSAAEDALLAINAVSHHVRGHAERLLTHPLRRAELFSMIVVALGAHDASLLAKGIDLSIALPDLQDACDAALAWAAPTPLLDQTLDALPLSRQLPLVAHHARDMPDTVERMLHALPSLARDEANLRPLLAFGQAVGAKALLPAGLDLLTHPDAALRSAAARLILALAPSDDARIRAQARDTLLRLATDDVGVEAAIHRDSVRSLFLHLPEAARTSWPTLMIRTPHLAVEALGWSGDVAAVPQLVELLPLPGLARIAGASLSLISGADVLHDGWLGQPPASPDPDVSPAPDAMPPADGDDDLPWPDPRGFETWWRAHAQRFDPATRWLAGRPIDDNALRDVLRRGPLPWRPLAAQHLQHRHHSAAFPTDAPAARQRAWLSGSAR